MTYLEGVNQHNVLFLCTLTLMPLRIWHGTESQKGVQINRVRKENEVETMLAIYLYIQGHNNGISGLVCRALNT